MREEESLESLQLTKCHHSAWRGHGFLSCAWVVYSKKGQINMLPKTKSVHRQWLNFSINQPDVVSHPQNTSLFEVAPHSSQETWIKWRRQERLHPHGAGGVMRNL